jgi:hypothetical protein
LAGSRALRIKTDRRWFPCREPLKVVALVMRALAGVSAPLSWTQRR